MSTYHACSFPKHPILENYHVIRFSLWQHANNEYTFGFYPKFFDHGMCAIVEDLMPIDATALALCGCVIIEIQPGHNGSYVTMLSGISQSDFARLYEHNEYLNT